MELHESGEMYLETILVLKNRLGLVRSIDIANEMGFSKPTISVNQQDRSGYEVRADFLRAFPVIGSG